MDIHQTVTDYITSTLLAQNGAAALGPDDNLLLSGMVDSLGVMQLVKFVEDQFAIKVQPGEVTLKNFKTVNAIAGFVGRKTAG